MQVQRRLGVLRCSLRAHIPKIGSIIIRTKLTTVVSLYRTSRPRSAPVILRQVPDKFISKMPKEIKKVIAVHCEGEITIRVGVERRTSTL